MRLVIILIFFLFSLSVYSFEASFQFIRSIGDDESDEYTIFQLSGAVISDSKDIFIIDHKGYSVSKYNWNGIFQKRVGQRGAGPKDFKSLNSIRFLDNRLHVLDKQNMRVASFGSDLENFDYFDLRYLNYENKPFHFIVMDCKVLEQGRFLFSAAGKNMEGNKLVITKRKEVEKIFHQYCPFDKSLIEKNVMLSILIDPVIGIDQRDKRLIVTGKFPPNEIVFFIYDFNGNLIKKVSIMQDKNFVLPLPLFDMNRRNEIKNKEPFDFTAIESIHAVHDYFIVFGLDFKGVTEIGSKASNKVKTRYYYILLDKDGSFLHKAFMEKPLHIFQISPEGYVLAKSADDEDEVEKLLIYKLELKGSKK